MFGGILINGDAGVYIRQAQFFIYPLLETQGPGDPNQAIVIKSTGSSDELRMVFRIQKNICATGEPNSMEVSIYNLSQATRQLLAKQATNIELQLGYQEGLEGVITVGKGGISSVYSERDQGDIKTTVFSYDGLAGLAEANSNLSYRGEIALAKILVDLANNIPGVEVSELNIKLDNGLVTGKKGRVLSGRTSTLLNKLAREFGFNWTIQNGVFKVIQDNFTQGNVYSISSENGNLINVSPRIDNVYQFIVGVDITVVLDPRIQPGDTIDLKSSVSPMLNNQYQVTTISHVGDTHGDTWISEIQCLFNEAHFIQSSANSPRIDQL